jgi:hypothetical protein
VWNEPTVTSRYAAFKKSRIYEKFQEEENDLRSTLSDSKPRVIIEDLGDTIPQETRGKLDEPTKAAIVAKLTKYLGKDKDMVQNMKAYLRLRGKRWRVEERPCGKDA